MQVTSDAVKGDPSLPETKAAVLKAQEVCVDGLRRCPQRGDGGAYRGSNVPHGGVAHRGSNVAHGVESPLLQCLQGGSEGLCLVVGAHLQL